MYVYVKICLLYILLIAGGSNPEELQQVMVPIIGTDTCNLEDWYDNKITENMVCAGYEEGGRDSCQVSKTRLLIMSTCTIVTKNPYGIRIQDWYAIYIIKHYLSKNMICKCYISSYKMFWFIWSDWLLYSYFNYRSNSLAIAGRQWWPFCVQSRKEVETCRHCKLGLWLCIWKKTRCLR